MKTVREEEVKLRRVGFVKQVGFNDYLQLTVFVYAAQYSKLQGLGGICEADPMLILLPKQRCRSSHKQNCLEWVVGIHLGPRKAEC